MLTILKGWRTVAFNAVVGLAGLLVLVDPAVFPDGIRPWFVMLVAAANIVLRFATTTPVGQREPDCAPDAKP